MKLSYQIDGAYVDPANLVVFQGTQEGLLSRAGRTIKAAAALERAAMNFAVEPIPQMVLKSNGTSLPADRVSKLLTAWRTARANKSTAFLNADVTLETLGYDPKNLQLNEARNYVHLNYHVPVDCLHTLQIHNNHHSLIQTHWISVATWLILHLEITWQSLRKG
jgi:hypothetical protein